MTRQRLCVLFDGMSFLLSQRLFWYIWNDDHSLIKVVLPSMLLFVLDLVIMLFVWLLVYRVQGGGVFSISGIGPILVVLLWVLFTLGFLWYELHVFLESVEKKPNAVKDLNQRFEEGEHTSVVFLTLGVLVWFTVVACIDSSRA